MCWRTYEITLQSGQIAYCWSRKLKYLRNNLSNSNTCFTCHVLSHYYTVYKSVYKSDEMKKNPAAETSCSIPWQIAKSVCYWDETLIKKIWNLAQGVLPVFI